MPWIGVVLLWLVSLLMRLWQLDVIEPPVFDEVYFPKFAESYLQGTTSYDVHPPLGKYFIMLGIQIWGSNPFGYRIMTALTGSLIPVLIAGVLYRLSGKQSLAFLGGALALLDGHFLVESRFGLINVYLVVFGLLAQVFLLAGLERRGWQRTLHFAASGLMLGASAAVKWNGLGFALGFAALGVLAWVLRLRRYPTKGFLAAIPQVRWWHYLLCFMAIPALLYVVQWVPHLSLSQPGLNLEGFWPALSGIHQSIASNHTNANVGVGTDAPVHPYCSPWYSWPLLARPISYHFVAEGDIWTSVNVIGNPILWWLSTLTMLGTLVGLSFRFNPLAAYCLIGFLANWLPWAMVRRCVFLYHYMSAYTFAIMGLAYVLWWLWQQPGYQRWLAELSLVAIIACFFFFLPLWYGWPLTTAQFYQRMWLRPNSFLPALFNWI